MADEIVRRRQLLREIGFSNSTLERLIQNKEFPAKIKLTPKGRAVGWWRSEVENWKQSRQQGVNA